MGICSCLFSSTFLHAISLFVDKHFSAYLSITLSACLGSQPLVMIPFSMWLTQPVWLKRHLVKIWRAKQKSSLFIMKKAHAILYLYFSCISLRFIYVLFRLQRIHLPKVKKKKKKGRKPCFFFFFTCFYFFKTLKKKKLCSVFWTHGSYLHFLKKTKVMHNVLSKVKKSKKKKNLFI